MSIPTLSLVLPCYNEAAILESSYQKISTYFKDLTSSKIISPQSCIVFVEDGSTDASFEILQNIQSKDPCVKVIKFSRNFGHQNAIMAGMFTFYKQCDCVITLDADLQDDILVIEEMLNEFSTGIEIVYGVRSKRMKDTFFKRATASIFYSLMTKMGVQIVSNHADYRLMSRNIVEELTKFEEVNLFLRGIFPLLGFKSSIVYYERKERLAGETKYPFLKMVSFAWDGITSFTIKPLRMVTFIGIVVFLISIILSLFTVISFFYLSVVPGWASIALPIYFLGGIQLLSIGILGEYVGKIYKEVKNRPRYIIEKIVG